MDKMNFYTNIKRRLFGHELLRNNVIVTPLDSIYKRILNKYKDDACEYTAMYSNCIIKDKVHVIKVPQGIQAQDAIIVCEDRTILFIGYAGGLDGVKIGDVVGVETAILPSGKRFKLKISTEMKNTICGYSPALLGNVAVEHQRNAKLLGCNIVDMEIAYCSSISDNNRFSAIVLITDLPGVCNFWELDECANDNIKNGKERLINIVYDHIDKLIAE